MQKDREKEPLDILNGSSQEGLFAHFPEAKHASKAQTMIDLGLRKRTFNGLFPP